MVQFVSNLVPKIAESKSWTFLGSASLKSVFVISAQTKMAPLFDQLAPNEDFIIGDFDLDWYIFFKNWLN